MKKESNKILGIKNKKNNIFEYRGMLISYYKNTIQINTLMEENVDFDFLVTILNVSDEYDYVHDLQGTSN